MRKLYFGEALDKIKNVVLHGFKPGDILKTDLQEAMMDSRNSVGLNQSFKPAVLVLEVPSNFIMLSDMKSEIKVVKSFTPIGIEVILVKIDFRSPRLMRVAGTVSPFSLVNMKTYPNSNANNRRRSF